MPIQSKKDDFCQKRTKARAYRFSGCQAKVFPSENIGQTRWVSIELLECELDTYILLLVEDPQSFFSWLLGCPQLHHVRQWIWLSHASLLNSSFHCLIESRWTLIFEYCLQSTKPTIGTCSWRKIPVDSLNHLVCEIATGEKCWPMYGVKKKNDYPNSYLRSSRRLRGGSICICTSHVSPYDSTLHSIDSFWLTQ